jgi:thiol-disulfide isomerase/thioredoxin
MGGKTAIALGLVTGLVAGGLIVGAVISLTPPPPAPTVRTPEPPTPSPTPSPTLAPSPSPSPAPSIAPSGEPDPSASPADEAFGIGEPAPALALPLVGGGTVDLADYRGKPVWVNFMGTWCPPCQDELPIMNGLHARYAGDTGLVVLAVDVREDEATVASFFDELRVDFPVALDTSGDAQDAWGAIALPVHFWIDGDGIVRHGALGGIGPDIMAQGLDSILDVEVTT